MYVFDVVVCLSCLLQSNVVCDGDCSRHHTHVSIQTRSPGRTLESVRSSMCTVFCVCGQFPPLRTSWLNKPLPSSTWRDGPILLAQE